MRLCAIPIALVTFFLINLATSLATPFTNLTLGHSRQPFLDPPSNVPSEKAAVALRNDMTLDITYYPTVQLPYHFRYALATVVHEAQESYDYYDPVPPIYTLRQFNCIFKAHPSTHAPFPLTWGLLKDTVELIGHFTLDNPYALNVIIRDGEDLLGKPVGFTMLMEEPVRESHSNVLLVVVVLPVKLGLRGLKWTVWQLV
ncbi:MAG: hypothetical protein Q9218_004453 [Villophora microphyllina]